MRQAANANRCYNYYRDLRLSGDVARRLNNFLYFFRGIWHDQRRGPFALCVSSLFGCFAMLRPMSESIWLYIVSAESDGVIS